LDLWVRGHQIDKKIFLPFEQQSHFYNHLSVLHDIGLDDDHVE
jgi:hypothetical protein